MVSSSVDWSRVADPHSFLARTLVRRRRAAVEDELGWFDEIVVGEC
jgi:hypothetical protein